jgi:hypothetical protein
VFFALPKFTRFLLIFTLAFLPLSKGLTWHPNHPEQSVGMSAPTPVLMDSAKTRANAAGIDRITLYLPSLYTNYLPYSYGSKEQQIFSSVVFSPRDLSQWQRWQL